MTAGVDAHAPAQQLQQHGHVVAGRARHVARPAPAVRPRRVGARERNQAVPPIEIPPDLTYVCKHHSAHHPLVSALRG